MLVAIGGVALTAIGVWGLMRSVVSPFVTRGDSVLEVLYTKRYLARGPRIVAIGGGTGLSTLLRGLKGYSANITAIVTMTDDGGSSGRLRQQLGIAPPGDIRNCIAALADAEPLMTQLMQYRFPPGSGLDDHAFGNLFIAAMTAVTGDFEEAVRESNRVLAVRGQVLPATSVPLNLAATLESGRRLSGQVSISSADEPIAHVSIEPADVRANPEAIERILEADLVVVGPGSLFSSVLPNLLITDIRDAVAAAGGIRVYVCNVATQPGETGFYSAAQHLETLIDHVGDGLFDYVLLNDNLRRAAPRGVARAAGAGGRAPTRGAADHDRRGGPRRRHERPPPRSGQARRGADADPAAGSRRASTSAAVDLATDRIRRLTRPLACWSPAS